MLTLGGTPQNGRPASRDDLTYALRGLGLAAAVLHLGVHPDDEEVGMIAHLARGVGARTVYWSATRGEGGQNRMSHERAEALGVLRTWESLAARAVDGGEVLYGPFYDFGFSKSAVDTFERWPREELVREIARAIRLVQPLVVVSRWEGTANDGHGQHQAMGQSVREAWALAADPVALPELALPAWEARKLYRSLSGDWQPGEDATPGARVPEHEEAGCLRIETGTVDAVSGRSMQELGHLALNQHRTQGMAIPPERGDYSYYYRLELGAGEALERETGFFDGLEIRLRGLAACCAAEPPGLVERLARADAAIDAATETFRPRCPAPAGTALLEALSALEEARGVLAAGDAALERYLGRKVEDVAAVAARCLGLRLECLLDKHRTTPGGRLRLTTRLWSDAAVAADIGAPELELPDRWSAAEVPAGDGAEGAAAEVHHELTVGGRSWAASPYWLRKPRRPYRYVWPSRGPLSLALDPPLVHARVDVRIGESTLRLRTSAHRLRAVPGGAGALPLTVLPPVTLEPRFTRMLLPMPKEPVTLEVPVLVRCLRDEGQVATIALVCPPGWTAEPAAVEVELERAGDERTIAFAVTLPADVEPGAHDLRYLVAAGGAPYGVALEPVRLGLGPRPPTDATAVAETYVTRPSTLTVSLMAVEFVPGHRYAYIPGQDEELLGSLEAFDLDLTTIEGEELAFTDLARYDAIVVGPNAYNARPAVRANAARLLGYVAAGGTLIVQYQTYGYDEEGLAPHPFTYHQPHDRVTLAQAPVTPLAPDHPVLHEPNVLGPEDWDGWVHDRGMYFFGTWDAPYTPILASSDPGEQPRHGGLLIAGYGRGTFAYTGYSLHRQIPAGVPGALRLLANLLGLAEARMRDRALRLRTAQVLSFLSVEELAQAARSVSERWAEAGEELVRAGERGGAIHVGLDGELEVISTNGAGEHPARVAAPGEPIGGYAVLLDGPFPETHRARAAGRVLELRGDVLRAWLRDEPGLADRLIGALAADLLRRDA